jgi:glycosyltransferase involved in cell wall biosynthesis
MARGHDVTLIAHPDSQTRARLVPYGRPPHTGWRARGAELAQVGGALWRLRRQIDVVHSFGRLAALVPVLPARSLPKIQSYQRDVPWTSVSRAVRLAGPSVTFTATSSSMYRSRPADGARTGAWSTIPNGVDVDRYTLQPTVDLSSAPLVFLGRLDPIKGAHQAIAIARAAGRRLVLAGNRIASGPDAEYFDREIAPHVNGATITYIGPVDDTAKNELLGRAAALLMPIEWEEPFGIVMAEAFACGTPVVAFARGSVSDVVRHGVNGFTCRTVDDAVAAVHALAAIDRRAVRADCEARFSARVIVDAYVTLYRHMLDLVRPAAGVRAIA